MEDFNHIHISWFTFSVATIILIVLFQLVSISVRKLQNFMFLGRIWIPASDLSGKFMIILEPLVIAIITGLFIAIHPLFHSIGVIVLSALTFLQIRDYLSGRIIYFTSNIFHDKKIIVGTSRGSVVKMGRLGLHININEGILYLNHYKIILYHLSEVHHNRFSDPFELTPILF